MGSRVKVGRNYVSDAARRYLRDRMGIKAPVLEDQFANQMWRHLYQFGMRMVRAERRRRTPSEDAR